MTECSDPARRIIVLSRPILGRRIEKLLRDNGYEVHRTPGGDDLGRLLARLRPDLVIAALDIPWADPMDIMQATREGSCQVPVLLLGEADPRLDGTARLPIAVADSHLLETTRDLIATSDPLPEHRSPGAEVAKERGEEPVLNEVSPLREQMRRRHVLIVNRDTTLLEGARALLQDERYNVTITSLVPKTGAMIAVLDPDVLVVDLALDEPELWSFVEHLATTPWLQTIPVIFTAADPAMLDRAHQIPHRPGGRFVFLKPFRAADLVDCVHALVGSA